VAWRAMDSLLVLRAQVDAIAPARSKASDGLVGDENHASTSGHYPHTVPGVGTEIVTAWDCTDDPADGCDSRKLAETLRRHRDKRIRYVISEREIFSSYASGSRPAWEWGPYSGTDPHTNHAHVQVLDAPISDTSTPWDLGGFAMTDPMWTEEYTPGWFIQALCQLDDTVKIPAAPATKVVNGYAGFEGAMKAVALFKKIDAQVTANGQNLSTLLAGQSRVEAALARIEAKVDALTPGGGSGGPSQAEVVAWVKQALREGTAS